MKILFLFTLALVPLGCQKDQVEAQEEKATLLGYWYASSINASAKACADGYQIRTESGQYRTLTLPTPFDKATSDSVGVWIRYKVVANDNCSTKSIEVISIRKR
ncbi:hypothetical protein [Spirosoma endophyticum]|uniref:Uncharacterized protein n=1 Tax=Spirosoma endophyticum TaxID=662367 RepID=A0A1I2I401_9BACT|nr:hypothetical protein [Spirosoma endophyticum]SFF36904.1 hypothetical protein SAMN05216167_1567 [Spirosoma endophyticum]